MAYLPIIIYITITVIFSRVLLGGKQVSKAGLVFNLSKKPL